MSYCELGIDSALAVADSLVTKKELKKIELNGIDTMHLLEISHAQPALF